MKKERNSISEESTAMQVKITEGEQKEKMSKYAIFLLTDEGFPSYNFYKKAGFSDLKGTVSLGKNI